MQLKEKIYYANSTHTKAEIIIVILSKIDLKFCQRYKFYNDKWSIHADDIIIISIYAPKRAPKHTKQNLVELKQEIENFTVTVDDFGNNVKSGKNNQAEGYQEIKYLKSAATTIRHVQNTPLNNS